MSKLGKKKREGKKEEEVSIDRPRIDLDLGIINLSGFFDLANKIADLGLNLKDVEKKFYEGDIKKKARIESSVRIGGLLGGEPSIRIGTSDFMKRLDDLARERKRGRVSTPKRVSEEFTISPRDVVQTEMTADVIEREDRVYVLTRVPYERDKIQVSFRKREDGGQLIVEAPSEGYRRLIPISVEVEVPEEVQWSYKNNIVEVVLPKPSETKKKRAGKRRAKRKDKGQS